MLAGNDPAKKAAERAVVLRDLVDRMIDERIEEREADKAHISATPDEVDNGINQVAAQAKLPKSTLFEEAKRQGMSEQDYREEIRRQIIEGKLLQLRVRSRVKVSDDDAKKTYDAWVKSFRAEGPIELKMLVLRVGTGADAKKQTEARAAQLAQQAKGGADFCKLVAQHSQDDVTKSTCGSRGPVASSALFPDIAKAGGALKPGETGAPLYFRDPSAGEVYLVIQRGAAVPVPTFESVKDQMKEKAYMDVMDRERKQWLGELKKGVYVDVRL
jgi:peptidyl-prolyl cis-trans isomerase SurA